MTASEYLDTFVSRRVVGVPHSDRRRIVRQTFVPMAIANAEVLGSPAAS
jgi:hypothetical protein